MTLNEICKTLGKEVRLAAEFENKDEDDTFGAYHKAEQYCKALGLSVGRMCSPQPTGLKEGEFDIQKWKNLDAEDIGGLDGVIVGNYREGPVKVYLSYEFAR